MTIQSPMSTLGAGSPEAARVTHLTWFLIILATVVYAIVIGVMLVAIRRGRSGSSADVDLTRVGVRPVIIGGAVIPGVILVILFVAGLCAMRAYPTPVGTTPVRFVVIGHQWWWEVHYPSLAIATANEIHLPVNRPVQLLLQSADVIHSFWVPRLQGKIDVIPGDTNLIRFTATKTGRYRGQCAEYCGMQHANMAFEVVVDDDSTYQRWLATQQQPAAPPTDSVSRLGEQLVVQGPSAMCHTIRGTPAAGIVGPDLSHLASRATIAAGALPNDRASLAGWISNAPALKPGVGMPALPQFTGRQLLAITTYLESLR
jgi:cytochrome c oxidase subunit 2